jgi:hypothetical protein
VGRQVHRSASDRKESLLPMVDPIAITAGVSVAGYATTYLVQRKSSSTAIETAAKQSEVAMAGLAAENERLRTEHQEGERRNRQDTYLKMLVALDRFDALATGFAPGDEQLEEALGAFYSASGAIQIIGGDDVKTAMEKVWAVLEEAGAKLKADEKVASFSQGLVPLRIKLNAARAELADAMAEDVRIDNS